MNQLEINFLAQDNFRIQKHLVKYRLQKCKRLKIINNNN